MKLGIDASNITIGGGVTHITEIFKNLNFKRQKFDKIIIWGNSIILKKIKNNKELKKINIDKYSNNIIKRFYWNFFLLPYELKKEGCNILFSPGGLLFRKKIKTVVMCRNMQPFELTKQNMYGISIYTIRLILLNLLLKFSFKRCDGLIFLTKYAKNKVNNMCKLNKKNQITIPHGVNNKFRINKKGIKKKIETNNKKINIIYVSNVEPYKNHLNLILAIRKIKIENFKINLNLIGNVHPKLKDDFFEIIKQKNPKNININYLGYMDYKKIQRYYKQNNIGVFASSCENMPNILIEMMSSKLPIACSNMGPMREILKNGGMYFNPYNLKSIISCILKLIKNRSLRNNLSLKALKYSNKFSWNKCSKDTFDYLYTIAKQ